MIYERLSKHLRLKLQDLYTEQLQKQEIQYKRL